MNIDVNKGNLSPHKIYYEQELVGLDTWEAMGQGEFQGKRYTLYEGIVHHRDIWWKIGRAVAAIMATVFSCGLTWLCTKAVPRLWQQARSGDEIKTLKVFMDVFPKTESSKDVDNHPMVFSSDEHKAISKIATELKKHNTIDPHLKIDQVKSIDPSLHNWIFEVDNFEGILFKMSLKNGFKERLRAIEYGQEVCQEYHLNHLKIPEITVIPNENLYAERKYQFIKNPKEIETIYSKETLSKIFEQLVIFICKTGTTDLTPQNYAFLADGTGVCLYDLEDINPEDPSYGLRAFIIGCAGGSLGSKFFEQTKEIIKAHAPETFSELFS